MTNDPTKLPLPEILSEAETIARDAQSTFGHLNAAQINWKPNADAWSVGQCFDHLMTANCEYFPQIDQVIRGEKKATLWQRMPWLPGPFGKMV
ncbi:MAG: DinB family protein, partial [Acidobacteria bacterium]|nr:DinB family protein [Acidobacteriota bacterium]